jgi:hypothetical protein
MNMTIIEHPILFSGEMVRAILQDRKTMTRRVIKPAMWPLVEDVFKFNGHWTFEIMDGTIVSPFGYPGDRLWVRETWKIASFMEGDPMEFQYRADGGEAEENEHYNELTYDEWFERICMQSTDYLEQIKWPNKDEDGVYRWDTGKSPLPWRPAIYMPRWASRINLEIVNVGVERVQEIAIYENVEDIFSEGLFKGNYCQFVEDEPCDINVDEALEDWKDLWNSINAKKGFDWEANPWVWVIEFKKVTP